MHERMNNKFLNGMEFQYLLNPNPYFHEDKACDDLQANAQQWFF